MDRLEKRLMKSAIYSPDEYKEADMEKILEGFNVEKKFMGQLARVYVVKEENWVIKEGRWDYSFEVIGDKKFPIPANLAEAFFGKFSMNFLPKKAQILAEYGRYLSFAQYFGYFKDSKTYYHPDLDLIFNTQKNIRNSLIFFRPELEKKYNFKFDKRIDEVLESDLKYENFLPKEYQLAGKSISPENKGNVTSFIFQQYVEEGRVLRGIGKDMTKDFKKQLLLMMYLILLMHYQTGMVADTRPKYSFFEAWDWITKTENILVSKDNKLVFIDTRWFWDTKSNFVRKGSIIPNLVIQKAKTRINELLNEI